MNHTAIISANGDNKMIETLNHVKISIIVPVYNVEKYLRQCLDSLINQTLKDIEIICVNDDSPDNSIDILNEYAEKDSRVRVINLKENRKQGGARNAGLQIAQGTYIGLVDSDDWVDTSMYESLWNASANGTIDIVCSDYYTYYEKNKQTVFTKNIPDNVINGNMEDFHKNVIVNGGRMWTNITKKYLFFDYDLLYPENVIYEDNAIGTALFCVAKTIRKENKPLYYYRQRELSTTTTKNDFRSFDRLTTAVMMLEHAKRLGYYEHYKAEFDYAFYRSFYRNTLIGIFFSFSPIPTNKINLIKKEFPKYVPAISKNKYYKEKKDYKDVFLNILQVNTKLGILLFKCFIGVARQIRKFQLIIKRYKL